MSNGYMEDNICYPQGQCLGYKQTTWELYVVPSVWGWQGWHWDEGEDMTT